MERAFERRSPSAATTTSSSSREGTPKAIVSEQISQAILSTSNLLHLMQHSSPSQAQLVKLPKNLLVKASTIKNTGQVLEQLPRAISALDAHTESGLRNVPHLKTVIQLLKNMENLTPLSHSHLPQQPQESDLLNQHQEAA